MMISTMETEKTSKFMELLRKFPVWARAVVLLLIAALCFLLSLSSCGVPRTSVTVSQGGTSQIEQNTTSSTTTTVTVTSDKTNRE